MRSKTSSFKGLNLALLRNDLSRFRPLWAVYGVIWLLMVPGSQFIRLFGSDAQYLPSEQLAGDAAKQLLNMGVYGGLWMAVIFGCLFAMALYSYLYNARSVGMMHAFPIRREGLFFTHYLAGLTVALGSLALCTVLTAAIQAAAGVLVMRNIAMFFFLTAGQMFFFYSFAVFCGMFTGQLLAVPVFYGIWNAMAAGLTLLTQVFARMFLFGFDVSGGLPRWVAWCTPVYQLLSRLSVNSRWDDVLGARTDVWVEGGSTVLAYIAAGVVLTGLAYLTYHFRRSESAGDTVSVGWAKELFRFGIGLGTALSLGQGLYWVLWVQFFRDGTGRVHNLGLASLCMVLVGVVGFYAADMLLNKSFRVIRKHWRAAALNMALILLVCVGTGADVLGVEHRVPDIGDVSAVHFDLWGGNSSLRGWANSPESIQALQTLHQTIVNDQKEQERRQGVWDLVMTSPIYEEEAEASRDEYRRGNVELTYHLTNGTVISRYYPICYLTSELDDEGSVAYAAQETSLDPGLRKSAIMDEWRRDFPPMTDELLIRSVFSGAMSYLSEIDPNGGYGMDYQQMDQQAAREVLGAILRDIDAGRGGRSVFDPTVETFINDFEFELRVPYPKGKSPQATEYYGMHIYLNLTPEYQETIETLRRLGVVQDWHNLITISEFEALRVQAEETGETLHLSPEEGQGPSAGVILQDTNSSTQQVTTEHTAAVISAVVLDSSLTGKALG